MFEGFHTSDLPLYKKNEPAARAITLISE